MSTFLPENKLTLCIDFSSLSSYAALSGTRTLVDECGIELNWLPLVKPGSLSSGKVQAADPLGEYKARRARARKMFADREFERDCARLGLSPDAEEIQYDHTAAAAGLLLLKEANVNQQQYWQYTETVYSAAFRDRQPIESSGQVEALISSLGIAPSEIMVVSGKLQEVEEVQEKMLAAGIFESPTFVYEGEVFLGRQHFPLLGWILKGRNSVAPIGVAPV